MFDVVFLGEWYIYRDGKMFLPIGFSDEFAAIRYLGFNYPHEAMALAKTRSNA